MLIGGLQKLSLVDYPGHVCSVVFTHGCVFRCRYCHNPELVTGPLKNAIPEKEVIDYLREHKKMLDGLCITGGEPTLHEDLPGFIQKVRGLGLKIKLDTNGISPDVIESLLDDKALDFIAMDLKNDWTGYAKVTQASSDTLRKRCRETFEIVQASGVDHEFRTTVLPGTHESKDFCTMAGWLKPGEKYVIQDIRYQKTLDTNLKKEKLDVDGIIGDLQARFPKLEISLRK